MFKKKEKKVFHKLKKKKYSPRKLKQGDVNLKGERGGGVREKQ